MHWMFLLVSKYVIYFPQGHWPLRPQNRHSTQKGSFIKKQVIPDHPGHKKHLPNSTFKTIPPGARTVQSGKGYWTVSK